MKKSLVLFAATAFLILLSVIFIAISSDKNPIKSQKISAEAFNDGIHHWNLEHETRTYHRLKPENELEIADNLVAWQNKDGGWPKNIDWLGVLNIDSVKSTLNEHYRQSTIDNRNTYSQIEYLSRAFTKYGGKKYKTAARKGMEFLLSRQYFNGGWRGWDAEAITFNDDVMTGVMNLFLDIVQGKDQYRWVRRSLRKKIHKSWDKGLELILECQIRQNGVKTAWAQQHDLNTLEPVMGRSFELPGITANESCSIISLLMKIENPSDEVIESVNSAVAWLKKSEINGIRIDSIPLDKKDIINHEYPYDIIVTKDSAAKPIWARYYEIDTNIPFMCTRGGEKVYNLADVDPERRTGYSWYGYWPEKVLKNYTDWKTKFFVSEKK
jgi:PelA/Pel-15E family pectate lyase